MGYDLAEVVGQRHAMFVDPADRDSEAYRAFWNTLNEGRFLVAEYKRVAKGGRMVWIQASYNPILGEDGKPYKVIKYASDVTAAKLKAADDLGQIQAIGRSQAIIEFNLDGTILGANENFLATMGYRLDEIVGRHHAMFVDDATRNSGCLPQLLAGARARRARFGRVQAPEEGPRRGVAAGVLQPDPRPGPAIRSRSSNTPPTSRRRR